LISFFPEVKLAVVAPEVGIGSNKDSDRLVFEDSSVFTVLGAALACVDSLAGIG
jgi:hypothetical protein